jgi:hypothetical protein
VYIHQQPLAEAAQALGISRDRAGQLHEKAVIALHDARRSVAQVGCACGRGNGSCGCSVR